MDLTSLTFTVKVYSMDRGSGIVEAMFRVGRMCVWFTVILRISGSTAHIRSGGWRDSSVSKALSAESPSLIGKTDKEMKYYRQSVGC